MEFHNEANSDSLYGQELAVELQKFAKSIGEHEIVVLVSSPLFRLEAIGFLPEVDEQTMTISLQPQLPSDSANGVLRVCLPTDGSADFSKKETDTGERIFSVYLELSGCLAAIHLATSAEALHLVLTESRLQ